LAFSAWGLDIDYESDPQPMRKREELERYVYQLSVLVETQIEELSEFIPPPELEKIRSDHYSWKINRDVKCAEAGRNTDYQFAELDCLAVATEKYFEAFELRLAELESATVKDKPLESSASNSELEENREKVLHAPRQDLPPSNKAMKTDAE
jgi:hypothetical protein